jgi:hypothetical protein
MNGNIWIDVTTLLRWEGRWTGIPRTMGCILEEWLNSAPSALRLCRFDPSGKRFLEVPCPQIEALYHQQAQFLASAGKERPAARDRVLPNLPMASFAACSRCRTEFSRLC